MNNSSPLKKSSLFSYKNEASRSKWEAFYLNKKACVFPKKTQAQGLVIKLVVLKV